VPDHDHSFDKKMLQSFAFALIAVIPTKKDQANAQFSSLSVTLTSCQQTYSPANSIINV
jgi:AAA+ superfamily predicted ATPase